MTDAEGPTRVFIYGSCVSRDTFEYLPGEQFTLVKYVARQSLISAFSRADVTIDLSGLESNFQRRMVEDDVAGSLPRLLAETAGDTDILLWDLADERLGVYRTPDGTYLTRSVEAIRAGLAEHAAGAWVHVPFGTDEHFDLWCAALEQFAHLRKQTGLADRTLLLQVPWAARTTEGGPAPASFGMQAEEANALFERYFAAAGDDPALKTVRIEDRDAVSDTDHRWGTAPFHYSPVVYRRLTDSIHAHSRVDEQSTTRPAS